MNDPNYYQNLKAGLLGQPLPRIVTDTDFPLPSEEQIQMYRSLQKLVVMPEFQDFFKFMRQEKQRCETTVSARSATPEELRWLKTIEEFVDKTADAVIGYISEFDQKDSERAKWLAEKEQQAQTSPS